MLRSLVLIVLTIVPKAFTAEKMVNLVENGDFQNSATGWRIDQSVASHMTEGRNSYVRITAAGGAITPVGEIAIQPGWRVLDVSVRMRTKGLVVGDANWKNARVALSFVMRDGTVVYPNMPQTEVEVKEWKKFGLTIDVPADAVRLTLQLAHFGSAGTADFDDVVVRPR